MRNLFRVKTRLIINDINNALHWMIDARLYTWENLIDKYSKGATGGWDILNAIYEGSQRTSPVVNEAAENRVLGFNN